jgi:formylglycine-generating enzyme required for sulfatase activity
MAELERGVFTEVESWLRPHFTTRDRREVLLTPLLSNWPGRAALEWEGSPDVFTTRLIQLLPKSLLVSVVLAAAEYAGVDQQQIAESLSRRVDPVSESTQRRSLPAVRLKKAPELQFAESAPVLYRAAGPLLGAHPAFEAAPPAAQAHLPTIDQVDIGKPLALITDFPLDAEHSLAALARIHGNGTWISGESLLEPDRQDAFRAAQDAQTLEAGSPGLLLVDFSAVRAEEAAGDEDRSQAGERLRTLLCWAESHGHKVVLGLPRYCARLLDLDKIRQASGDVRLAAELFSPRYIDRSQQCERLHGADLPLRDLLYPLLSANSATLPFVVSKLLTGAPNQQSRTAREEVDLALRIARGLTAYGFYEIAFRIESYIRTHSAIAGVIPLAADVWSDTPGTPTDRVVGFTKDVSDLPARAPRAVLIGPAGAGKTTALRNIEHRWSVPCDDDLKARSRTYLPLLVSLHGDTTPLRQHIDSHISRDDFGSMSHGAEQLVLDCHALVARLGTLAAMREVFSSPILLLLDEADQIPAESQGALGRDIASLRIAEPDGGLIIASRTERMARILTYPRARLRDLDEDRVDRFVSIRRGHPSLSSALAAPGRPLTRYVRNPQLLRLMCDLELTADELIEANLATIIQRFLTHRGRELSGGSIRSTRSDRNDVSWSIGEHTRRIATWLPTVAFELLTTRRQQRQASHTESSLVADARLYGLLRQRADPGLIEFRFEALKAYFAAVHLTRESTRLGIDAIMNDQFRQRDADDWASGEWGDVLRVFVTLLSAKDADRLVTLLARRVDPRLAHECALELPSSRAKAASEATTILVNRISAHGRPVQERVADARALDRLDPRITSDTPLSGMVTVPASKRLATYRVSKYPVTVLEYSRFIADGGYRDRSLWSQAGWVWARRDNAAFPRYWQNNEVSFPNHPVTGVNYFEANAYCEWMNQRHPGFRFRLPTALEWDRAAHGDDSIFEMVLAVAGGSPPAGRRQRKPRTDPWSGRRTEPAGGASATGGGLQPSDLDILEARPELKASIEQIRALTLTIDNYLSTHRGQLHHEDLTPVGVFPPNQLGIYDLFGAVWQWCGSAIATISSNESAVEDLRSHDLTTGTRVVVKGGDTFGSFSPIWVLIGGWFDPLVRFHRLGFRVACRARAD